MYQRKDKAEFPHGCQEGILDLFRLLESSNLQEVESVKSVIHENLSSAKDSKLLICIVDYYMALNSERALDILARVKDPHDKHLFDRINELMKSTNTRYTSLQLLCNLVYKQPNWVHRIASHRLMHSLFQLLKTDIQTPNLISALLIVVCLLPMIPSQFGPFLTDMFNVFSRLIAWNVKKPSSIPETFVLHLQLGVYSLFHRLYGMFPCNFLAYLRSFYGGRDYNADNMKVFTSFIKPMLERVRLHPLLVTASKETELSVYRWKKMEYHDVITDCASVSLDAIEGTLDGLRSRNQPLNNVPRRQSNLCAQNSLQYVSLSSQSSVLSASVEPCGLVVESMSSHRDSLWSPSHAYGSTSALVCSSAALPPLTNKADSETPVLQPMPLDLAVEAKAEELKNAESPTGYKSLSQDLKPSVNVAENESVNYLREDSNTDDKKSLDTSFTECTNSSFEKSVLEAVEAKEEDIDKEVSELTSNKSSESSPCNIRHDTPFCSTTQNLTDEPADLVVCPAPSLEAAENLTKNQDDDVDEMYSSMQDDAFIPTFTRFRFVSHCGPSIFPSGAAKSSKVVRSNSCPAKFCSSQSSLVDDTVPRAVTTSVVATCSSSVITTSGAFVTVPSDLIPTSSTLTYEQLLPMAMDPLPDLSHPLSASIESNYHSYNSLFTSLSPPELLDNYLQLGSETYVSSIPITSTKSTDWTYFGGKPPPDEIEILRKQTLLLHNQLLFERHRKDVHNERIRRILGRAKKSRMQDELIVALKEQINLLKTDNEKLKLELFNTNKFLNRFMTEKAQVEQEMNNLIIKIKNENTQLLFANQKLQNVLVIQKEANDRIIKDSRLYRETIINFETELILCQEELNSCRKLRKESEFLSKQLFLLQEIIDLYKEKIEKLKEPGDLDIGADLMKNAALFEIKALKTRLEYTCIQLDTANSKIVGLELIVSNMVRQKIEEIQKQKQKEHYQTMERLKAHHEDKINIFQESLKEARKISLAEDTHALKLQKDQETLREILKSMEKKLISGSAVKSQPGTSSECKTLLPTTTPDKT